MEIDYHYIIHYDTISGVLPSGYELTPDSVVLVELEFVSDELGYELSNTPFNYDYVSIAYSDYHIKLSIGENVIYSNDTAEFAKYVERIEGNVISFTQKLYNEDGYVANNTEISIAYVAKLQPGLIESEHFLIITYPWTNSFDTLLDGLFGAEDSTDELYRERFRKLTGGSIISPFEYSLSMNDTYSL